MSFTSLSPYCNRHFTTLLRMKHPPEPQEFSLIDIRKVWPGEAKEFTPWLAENLQALAGHLGIGELELDRTEVEVPGGRRLDILAKDPDGGKWAIENQYGEADHDHLTRALAYAVGLECRAVVVVAESHRDEFVAVADEWNRYSEAYGPSGIRLFLSAIEAGRIGNSGPGYRFRLVAGPNEWKSVTAAGGYPSEADRLRHEKRREFWSGLQKVMREKGNLAGSTSFSGQVNDVTVLTKKAFSFQFLMTMESCRVVLRIDSLDKKENNRLFDALSERKATITKSLDGSLEWINNEKHRVNRISWTPVGACGYRTPFDERQSGYEALADAMYKFRETLMPYIERLV